MTTLLRGVALACEWTEEAGRLRFHYTVANHGSHPIAVMDNIARRDIDGGYDFSPDNVFVHLDGDTLHFTKGSLPIPEGEYPALYVPTHAAKLPPSAEHRVAFVVPRPVRERHPYAASKLRGQVIAAESTRARAIEIHVGVVPLTPSRLLIREHPAFPAVMSVVPSIDVLDHQVMLTQRFELTTPTDVLSYRSHPWQ